MLDEQAKSDYLNQLYAKKTKIFSKGGYLFLTIYISIYIYIYIYAFAAVVK